MFVHWGKEVHIIYLDSICFFFTCISSSGLPDCSDIFKPGSAFILFIKTFWHQPLIIEKPFPIYFCRYPFLSQKLIHLALCLNLSSPVRRASWIARSTSSISFWRSDVFNTASRFFIETSAASDSKPFSWIIPVWSGLFCAFSPYKIFCQVSLDCIVDLLTPLSSLFVIPYWCLGKDKFQCAGQKFPMLSACHRQSFYPCM